jgi:meiotic recombination protein REC8
MPLYLYVQSANVKQFVQSNDDGFIPHQDDGYMMDQGEALPILNGQEEEQQQHSVTSESAEAEQRRRPRAGPKVIPLDNSIELHNHDISAWNQQYKENMNEALRHKRAHRLVTLAKKNAEHWVLGPGDNGLLQSDRGPLNMFTGIKLLEAMTGLKLTAGGEKRARDDDTASEDSRRVRSRAGISSDEVARGFDFQDDGFAPMADDYTIEQGRDQPTPLDDRHVSSVFPWNQSTGSRRPTALFSAGGTSAAGALPAMSLSRRGSRLPTASPLVGRGLDIGNDDDDLNLAGSNAYLGATAEEEFELFGPAAQVDTQTAAESQWVRAALDGESANFLEFVKAGIDEADQKRATAPPGDEEDETMMGCIDFDQLLPPMNNTRAVAAQGLLHVLALVTKNALVAAQEETFGPIGLRVLEV